MNARDLLVKIIALFEEQFECRKGSYDASSKWDDDDTVLHPYRELTLCTAIPDTHIQDASFDILGAHYDAMFDRFASYARLIVDAAPPPKRLLWRLPQRVVIENSIEPGFGLFYSRVRMRIAVPGLDWPRLNVAVP